MKATSTPTGIVSFDPCHPVCWSTEPKQNSPLTKCTVSDLQIYQMQLSHHFLYLATLKQGKVIKQRSAGSQVFFSTYEVSWITMHNVPKRLFIYILL